MRDANVRALFGVAAVYDFLLGLVFLCFGPRLFAAVGLSQPNHWGYIQFAALQLMVFAAMFAAIARDPLANRNLVPYGMLLKLAYVGLVSYYWATGDCPWIFKPFALVDAAMLVLFGIALRGPAAQRVGPAAEGEA